MIACDSYLSLFFFTLQKKLRSGAIVRFSDNSSYGLISVVELGFRVGRGHIVCIRALYV